jgi:hypothetical protein
LAKDAVSGSLSNCHLLPSDYPGLYNSGSGTAEPRKQAFFAERTWFGVVKTVKTICTPLQDHCRGALSWSIVVDRSAIQREPGTDLGMVKTLDRGAIHDDALDRGAIHDNV